MPAPSWPSTIGVGSGIVPFWTERSEWHTPEAAISMRTSPGPGAAMLMSSRTSRGVSTAASTAAFIVSLIAGKLPCRRRAGPSGSGAQGIGGTMPVDPQIQVVLDALAAARGARVRGADAPSGTGGVQGVLDGRCR